MDDRELLDDVMMAQDKVRQARADLARIEAEHGRLTLHLANWQMRLADLYRERAKCG